VQTILIERLGLRPGSRVLDLGCGQGRHVHATRLREGVAVVGLDLGVEETRGTATTLRAMDDAAPNAGGAAAGAGPWLVLRGDGYRLPFRAASFDCVIASEVLEHLHQDDAALDEISRVLKPGGRLAVSVPRFGPELICWALSDEYANSPGGHVRIYRRGALRRKLTRHGYAVHGSHHAHALHSPYWWIKCAVGIDNDTQRFVRLYHQLLVWDMFKKPRVTRVLERTLDPLIGKSLVYYATKAAIGERAARPPRAAPGDEREGADALAHHG